MRPCISTIFSLAHVRFKPILTLIGIGLEKGNIGQRPDESLRRNEMRINHLRAAGAFLAVLVSASAQTYTFDPTGSTETLSYAINTSGAITGHYFDANNGVHGFVRDPQGNITSFDPP